MGQEEAVWSCRRPPASRGRRLQKKLRAHALHHHRCFRVRREGGYGTEAALHDGTEAALHEGEDLGAHRGGSRMPGHVGVHELPHALPGRGLEGVLLSRAVLCRTPSPSAGDLTLTSLAVFFRAGSARQRRSRWWRRRPRRRGWLGARVEADSLAVPAGQGEVLVGPARRSPSGAWLGLGLGLGLG